MRLRLTLDMTEVTVPNDYKRGLQAFIYSSLSAKSSQEIHDLDSSIVKLFTYSNLLGKCHNVEGGVEFEGRVNWFIASADLMFLDEIYRTVIETKTLSLHGNYIPSKDIKALDNLNINGVVEYRTISPVTVYRSDEEGNREYGNPLDPNYREYIYSSLRRKYEQFYGETCNEYMNLYHIQNCKKRIVGYKNYKYEAYDYTFKFDSSERIHNLIMDTGIGSRNASGFVMVEIV